ncbi:MAG: NAD(P)-dependent oxidoreductase [Betaproteobacteria bacterium]|jgi:3-hydroxyisobutyrate dehydrogenase|nr:NAD(P)-dependent oxidoreductase [Betaproteobacteria bacterium]NBP45665.1 NAD(P)-dependent oxidoreductase [Betaproteobacteria bacterium]
MSQRILFIGLGNMGHPMAHNLLKAGHAVVVHDLDPTRAEDLLKAGATWADSIAEGMQSVDVILSSLPGPVQVEAVMLGAQGVCEHLRPGMVLIDTSTSSVDLAKTLDRAARAKGANYLEAPITNAIDGAREGRLSIFVGGDQAVYEACTSIFEPLGKHIFHLGPVGTAATVKLLTNLLWFVSAATIAEALMLGVKAGVPLETVWAALKVSAGNSWVVEHDVPSIFAGHYDPSFTLALCVKDLELVNRIAQQSGIDLFMGQHALSRFKEAMHQYGPQAAELNVARLVEEQVGLLLRPPHGMPIEAKTHGT